MKQWNMNILKQVIDDAETLDIVSIIKKYIEYIDDLSFKKKLESYETYNDSQKMEEQLREQFNILLFNELDVDYNDANNLFITFSVMLSNASENVKNKFLVFANLNNELEKLKEKNFDLESFMLASEYVQLHCLQKENKCGEQKYFDFACDETKNKYFEYCLKEKNLYKICKLKLSDEKYISYREQIENIINQQVEISMEEVEDYGMSNIESELHNLYNALPYILQIEFLDKFSKKYIELINNKKEKIKNRKVKEIISILSGEEIVGILNKTEIELEEGEILHLDFSNPKIGVEKEKLLDLSKKYQLSCSFTLESAAQLDINTIEELQQSRN